MPHAGNSFLNTLAWLTGTLGQMLCFPVFKAHLQQLLQDEQLCGGLLRLLLSGTSAMAVGLQLPADRRLAGCDWHNAVRMAAFVSRCLKHTQQWHAIAAAPDAAWRLLAAAAQLLQCCPYPALPPADVATSHALGSTMFLIWQLRDAVLLQYPNIVCSCQQLEDQPDAAPLAPELPARQAHQLLAALPKIGEALACVAQTAAHSLHRLAYSAGTVSTAAAVMALLAAAAQLPAPGAGPAAGTLAVEDLPAWLHGAVTALRWLPTVVSIAYTQSSCSTNSLPPIRTPAPVQHLWLCCWQCMSVTAALRPCSWPTPAGQTVAQQYRLSAWQACGSCTPLHAGWCTPCQRAPSHGSWYQQPCLAQCASAGWLRCLSWPLLPCTQARREVQRPFRRMSPGKLKRGVCRCGKRSRPEMCSDELGCT